jgi:type I restriction-modification system DNA methylase subunit
VPFHGSIRLTIDSWNRNGNSFRVNIRNTASHLLRYRSKDILRRMYEFLLGQFANAKDKNGGEFYTTRRVVSGIDRATKVTS